MHIQVKIKLKAAKEGVEKVDEKHLIVSVKEPPVKGRANQAVLKALAKYFGIATPRIKIITGRTSRQKTVEIT